MKITKDDWMKLASPVVLIVVGILLACSIIDSVGNALQLIVGIVLLIIGAIYMSLGFVKNKNVLDRYSIYGIGIAGLGVGLIVMNGVLNGILSYLGIAIGWALFIFGCLGFIFSIVYLCLHRSVKFYVTELVLSIVIPNRKRCNSCKLSLASKRNRHCSNRFGMAGFHHHGL